MRNDPLAEAKETRNNAQNKLSKLDLPTRLDTKRSGQRALQNGLGSTPQSQNQQQLQHGESKQNIAALARQEYYSVIEGFERSKDLIEEIHSKDFYNFTSPNYWHFLQERVQEHTHSLN